MDKEVVNLCSAMNKLPGITTIDSCCGHNEYPYRIFFMVTELDDLIPITYFANACHSGCRGWKVIARTDCAMSPISFLLEGPVGAYEDAIKIAKVINKFIEKEK